MGNQFGKKLTLKEQLRLNKRQINRAIREIDRERMTLQNEDKKTAIEIKKLAKEGQMGAVRALAKDIARIRASITKCYGMRSQLQGIALKMETMKTTEAMTSAMKGTTVAMQSMAKQIDSKRLNDIMREFMKESEKSDMQQEMLGDTLDTALDADGVMDESDQIVNQILDEIGIDVSNAAPEAPKKKVEVAKENANAVPAAAPPAAPVLAGLPDAPSSNNMPSQDTALNDLEARLKNLRGK